jgi:hypothetical protein
MPGTNDIEGAAYALTGRTTNRIGGMMPAGSADPGGGFGPKATDAAGITRRQAIGD